MSTKRKLAKHNPEGLEPRVFKKRKKGAFHVDLRYYGEGRPILRDPSHPESPAQGDTTTDEKTAKKWARDYALAARKRRDNAEEVRTGKYRSIDTAGDAYLRHVGAQKAVSTRNGARAAINHVRKWVHRDGLNPDPHAMTARAIQTGLDSLLTEGYKPNTVRTLRTHLIGLFSFCGTPVNPALASKVPGEAEQERVPWNDEERARLRQAADDLDETEPLPGFSRRLFVEFMLGSGCRIQEAAGIRWKDFEMEAGIVVVEKQLARGSNERVRTKGKKRRSVALLPSWWRFAFERFQRQGGLLFHDGKGKAIAYRKLYEYVVEISELAGVKKEGEAAHPYRHTYAYLFLKGDGVPGDGTKPGNLDQLSRSLGHGKISTTQKHYGHFSSDESAKVAARGFMGIRGPRRPKRVA